MFIHQSIIILNIYLVYGQINLINHFGNCRTDDESFNECVKDGLNALRPYYKSGLPQYGIAPFDPFFAREIVQERKRPLINYKLSLENVTESGWTVSKITKFNMNPTRNSVQYTQFFPDKKLDGHYRIEGSVFGRKMHNAGAWNLSLYDFVQTTTVTRKSDKIRRDTSIKVNVNVQRCKKLELHIENLAGGRVVLENVMDWVINNAWQPGFVVLSPLINDLVSTAFTEIFNKNFQHFPFEDVFQH